MGHWQSLKQFLAPRLRHLAQFLTSQGITMAGNLFYGFLCVRLLPLGDYAKFAVVFGLLATFIILMDFGTSSTLLPLIGESVDDLQLIADYVAALRKLARWLYLLVAPFILICYPLIVRRQHWGWPVVAGMVAILLVASWWARLSSIYGAVLIVRRDRPFWYRAQMIASLGTLALLCAAWATHTLNAFSAILINVAGILYVSSAYSARARVLLGVEGNGSPVKRKAILHLALPITPNVIFYALQGQISLVLITMFGHASSVASVGALNRLGQVFALLIQMNPLLIEPYFASLPRARLTRNYFGVLTVVGAFSLLVAGLAGYFPQIFLWILGHKYSGLHYEVFLAMVISSISYFYGVLCAIHAARRFIYWWNGAATIVLVLAAQIVCVFKVDLSTVRGVLMLNLATAVVILLVNAATGVYGFARGGRQTPGMVTLAESDTYAQP